MYGSTIHLAFRKENTMTRPMSAHVVSVSEEWTSVHFTLHGGGVWDLSTGDGQQLRDALADKLAGVHGVTLVNVRDDGLSIEHAEHAHRTVKGLVEASCRQAGIRVA